MFIGEERQVTESTQTFSFLPLQNLTATLISALNEVNFTGSLTALYRMTFSLLLKLTTFVQSNLLMMEEQGKSCSVLGNGQCQRLEISFLFYRKDRFAVTKTLEMSSRSHWRSSKDRTHVL